MLIRNLISDLIINLINNLMNKGPLNGGKSNMSSLRTGEGSMARIGGLVPLANFVWGSVCISFLSLLKVAWCAGKRFM